MLKYKKSEVGGIVFSDLHIHKWKAFNLNNKRVMQDIDVLAYIASLCIKYNCPAIFCGDLYENPKQLDNLIITLSHRAYKRYFEKRGIEFICISGNHDMSENNTDTHQSPSYLHSFKSLFKTFKLIDRDSYESKNFKFHGIPYLNKNKGFEELVKKHYKNRSKTLKNILLIHSDLPGAVDTDGRIVGSSENIPNDMGKYFKGFDLVLCGHIHKPQVIVKGHVYMIGAPKHQDRGDMGCEMGCWILYKDCHLEFFPLKNYPQFKYIEHNEELPDDFNFYIRKPEPIKEEEKLSLNFDSNTERKVLGKNYLKAIGIKDKSKRKLLLKILEKSYDK